MVQNGTFKHWPFVLIAFEVLVPCNNMAISRRHFPPSHCYWLIPFYLSFIVLLVMIPIHCFVWLPQRSIHRLWQYTSKGWMLCQVKYFRLHWMMPQPVINIGNHLIEFFFWCAIVVPITERGKSGIPSHHLACKSHRPVGHAASIDLQPRLGLLSSHFRIHTQCYEAYISLHFGSIIVVFWQIKVLFSEFDAITPLHFSFPYSHLPNLIIFKRTPRRSFFCKLSRFQRLTLKPDAGSG